MMSPGIRLILSIIILLMPSPGDIPSDLSVVIMKAEDMYVVLVPIAIPATGKSTVFNRVAEQLKDKGVVVHTVSSDLIRADLMQEMVKRGVSKDQAFQKTGKAAGKEFDRAVGRTIHLMAEKPAKHLLYVDKNFPPDGLGKILDLVQEGERRERIKIRTIGMVAGSKAVRIGGVDYPFDLDYLGNCLLKGISRKDHETLGGSQAMVCAVIIGFFKLFAKFQLSEATLKKYFNQEFFVDFNSPLKLSQQDEALFKTIIDESRKFNEHKDLPRLIDALKKYERQDTLEESVKQAREALFRIMDV